MSRWFNIAGPCIAADHYMLPASERLPDVWSQIRKKQYFLVHAPRQCGKTTVLCAKSPEKAHEQILKYMDGLGVSEGWLVVADADVTKPWDGKISTTDRTFGTKTVHLVCC